MALATQTDPLKSLESRPPLVELLRLAAPTVAQMASYTLMQFADRWMLAQVGELPAAAAGTAGIVFFCVLGFGYGLLLVVNTLVAQAFGRGEHRQTGKYLWQGLWIGGTLGLLTLLFYPLATELFVLMDHEPRMAALEGRYLRIVTLGGWAKLGTVALAQFLLGVHRPMPVFIAAVAGVAANLLFNWLLIYGNGGFPAMGIAGAAWATNAAVVLELGVMAAFVARPAFRRVFNTGDWRPRWRMAVTLLRVGSPAGVQLTCDIVAWMIFMNVIIARFGTPSLSANSFTFSYMHLCFMPAIGVGAAVTALVGRYIGMRRYDLAQRRAHLGFFVCAVYMVAVGIVLFVFRYPLLRLFTDDPETLRIGAQIMLFVALYQIFDAMFVIYVGALRGAGDTLVPAVVQTVLVWTIVVLGGGLLSVYAPQYGVVGPWVLATLFGAILGLFLLHRFVRGGWKSIDLEGTAAHAETAPGAAGGSAAGGEISGVALDNRKRSAGGDSHEEPAGAA